MMASCRRYATSVYVRQAHAKWWWWQQMLWAERSSHVRMCPGIPRPAPQRGQMAMIYDTQQGPVLSHSWP